MSPFDRLLALRTVALGGVLGAMAVGVVVATDEPGSTLGMRAARLAALLPGLAVVAESIALGQCRARGEVLALAALGASPRRIALGAMIAGWALAALAIGLLLSPLSDPRSLFPSVAHSNAWLSTGTALHDPLSGVSVLPSGALSLGEATAAPLGAATPSRGSALACIAPLALFAPVWSATQMGLVARLAGAGLALVLAIVLLHAVAAGRVPPWLLACVCIPLLLQLAWHGRDRL
jgi:hypothetical protein